MEEIKLTLEAHGKKIEIIIQQLPNGNQAVDCKPNYALLGSSPIDMMARSMLAAVGIPDGGRNWKQTIDKREPSPSLRLTE